MEKKIIFEQVGDLHCQRVHINTELSQSLIDRLMRVSGVDKIYKETRYQFLLSIGKLFDPLKVMNELGKTYINY